MPNRTAVRVMLVDDSADDRAWLARMLAEHPSFRFEIEHAESLADARRLASVRTFDLALVDWELPDGTGIELHEHPPTGGVLPLVVVTGHEEPRVGPSAIARGAAEFVSKRGLTAEVIATACVHALVRARLERSVQELRTAGVAAARREHEALMAAEIALANEKRARARVTTLQVLSAGLSAAATPADVTQVVVQHAAIFEGAIALSIYVLEGESLHLCDAYGFTQAELASWIDIPLTANNPLTDAARRGEAVRIENADDLRQRYPRACAGDASWIAFPLATEGETLGVLGLRFAEGTIPALDGVDFLVLVVQCIGQALHRARLYERARQNAVFDQRLLAMVGHDLRTPLHALTMAAALLKMKDPHDGLVKRLERSVGMMASLVDDVLDRSALRHEGAGGHSPLLGDVEAVTREQLDELRAVFHESEILLDQAEPVAARCDSSRVSQILANLVRNAVQHGAPGKPVTVRLRSKEPQILLSVHNEGPPILADDLPKLFDPFHRGRASRGKGSGLGLFIVRETVSLLGGHVSVTSDHNGTSFLVTFPDVGAAASVRVQPSHYVAPS